MNHISYTIQMDDFEKNSISHYPTLLLRREGSVLLGTSNGNINITVVRLRHIDLL
jgi:hypothetical protein